MKLLWVVFFVLQSSLAAAFSLVPARRQNTTATKNGYVFVPVYGQVPGVGEGYGFGFLDANILNSRTELGLGAIAGNIEAGLIDLSNIHLGENITCEFTAYGTRLNYEVFGRSGYSDQANDFSPLYNEYGAQGIVWGRFFDSRLQMYAHLGPSKFQIYQVSDQQGDTFNNADNSFNTSVSFTFGAELDLTDNLLDPRKGLRIDVQRDGQTIFDENRSQFYVLNISSSAYIPIGNSTLVFNYLRSSSFVTLTNTMDQSQLTANLGLNCSSIADATIQSRCLAAQTARVTERLAENKYGTAAPLGGSDRLRGYVQNRFHAAEDQFWGSEFRWNLVNTASPFDLGVIKGALSNIQLALFYELGSVSDPPVPVEEAPWRADYGAGLRLIFSGLVVRADAGFSDEGTQLTVFIGYPWQGSLL